MDNMPFVIWMVLWPFTNTVDIWICEKILERDYSTGMKFVGNIIGISIWVYVGNLLYHQN